MKNEIPVSVVIPAYNQACFLAGAIESVLSQTYPYYEIIVVDDGSTDETRQIAAKFGNRIRYFFQENRGLAGARNTGILAANYELIGLLDADDQWKPNYLEVMVNLALQNITAVAYYCQAQCMDANGQDQPRVLGGPPVLPEKLYWAVLGANFIIPSTVLLRKQVLVENGLFDPSLRSCEDWDLWLRLLPKNYIIGSPERLVRYRNHGSSLSTNVQGMQHAVQRVVEKHFGPDDNRFEEWSFEKRRAYGGVYRYSVLAKIQRNNDWGSGSTDLQEALKRDPTLAEDLSLFYDLALGNQPIGYRGSNTQLDIGKNAKNLSHMLERVFDQTVDAELQSLRHKTYGTAFFAIGLLAYNTSKRFLSRRYLLNALIYRPELWRDRLITGNLIKSFLSQSMIEKLKKYRYLNDSRSRYV